MSDSEKVVIEGPLKIYSDYENQNVEVDGIDIHALLIGAAPDKPKPSWLYDSSKIGDHMEWRNYEGTFRLTLERIA